jgi:hypothetical protein
MKRIKIFFKSLWKKYLDWSCNHNFHSGDDVLFSHSQFAESEFIDKFCKCTHCKKEFTKVVHTKTFFNGFE